MSPGPSPFVAQPNLDAHLGLDYTVFLGRLLEAASANAYLEIGTTPGASLERVTCPAVCVDPKFSFSVNPAGARRITLLYQMTSDEFFAECDPRHALGREIDVAFLDGMHHFEYLLRDIINTEATLHREAVMLLHDCLPLNSRMAERTPARADGDADSGEWWAGDVWKVLFALKEHRPDLNVALLDCSPTGMAMIAGLNPESTVLRSSYSEIVEKLGDWDLDEKRREALFRLYPTVSTAGLDRARIGQLLHACRVRGLSLP